MSKEDHRRRVILVTDGDEVARRAVEVAAANVGGRTISMSAGNPTPLSGPQLVTLLKQVPYDPVVVMLDDRGFHGAGRGERAMDYIAGHPDIEVLGVVAVASNTLGVAGVQVDRSITQNGQIVAGPVDKFGIPGPPGKELRGDTVEILRYLNIPVVIGLGDVGKMGGADDYRYGAPITTRALQEILNRSGFYGSAGRRSPEEQNTGR